MRRNQRCWNAHTITELTLLCHHSLERVTNQQQPFVNSRGAISKGTFLSFLLKMDMFHSDLQGLTPAFNRNPWKTGSVTGLSAKQLCFWPTCLQRWLHMDETESLNTLLPWRKEGYGMPDQRECRCSTSQPRGDGEPSCFASIIPSGPHL